MPQMTHGGVKLLMTQDGVKILMTHRGVTTLSTNTEHNVSRITQDVDFFLIKIGTSQNIRKGLNLKCLVL